MRSARARPTNAGSALEIALVLFVTYLLSLVFSLRTHRHLYVGEEAAGADEHPGAWSRRRSFVVLMVASGLIAVMAELLVGSVEHAATALGLTEVFVGVILVAIVGNAAEHSTAVLVAIRGKMDLAVHIAIGSSLQTRSSSRPCCSLRATCSGHPWTWCSPPSRYSPWCSRSWP